MRLAGEGVVIALFCLCSLFRRRGPSLEVGEGRALGQAITISRAVLHGVLLLHMGQVGVVCDVFFLLDSFGGTIVFFGGESLSVRITSHGDGEVNLMCAVVKLGEAAKFPGAAMGKARQVCDNKKIIDCAMRLI